MPRRRMIDPAIWDNEDFENGSRDLQIGFVRLFSMADDEGKGKASELKWVVKDVKLLKKLMKDLEGAGLAIFYTIKDGLDSVMYYQLPKWFRHQTINRPRPSHILNHPKLLESVPECYWHLYSLNGCTESIHGKDSMNRFNEAHHPKGREREKKGREGKKEREGGELCKCYKKYEEARGSMVSSMEASKVHDLHKKFTCDLICQAIEESVKQGKPNIAYIEGICKNCKLEGRRPGAKKKTKDRELPDVSELEKKRGF